jgi:hypothetical protein
MININKVEKINAPIEEIFRYIENPENLKLYFPNIVDIINSHISEKKVGDSFVATFITMGVVFEELFTVNEYEDLNSISLNFAGVLNGKMGFNFHKIYKDVTLANFYLNYRINNDISENPIDSIIFQRLSTINFERVLENLKLVSETSYILSNSKIYTFRKLTQAYI